MVFVRTKAQRQSRQGIFLAPLTWDERLMVADLDPLLYKAVMWEKMGKASSFASSDSNTMNLLRKLDLADLQRLAESAKHMLAADKIEAYAPEEAMRLYRTVIDLNPYHEAALVSYAVMLARNGYLLDGVLWVQRARNHSASHDDL